MGLTEFWSYMYQDIFHRDQFMFYINVTSLWMNFVFWGLSGLFMIPDVTGKPKWMLKYKVQPGVNEPLDPERTKRAVQVAFVNQLFISAPILVLLYPLRQHMGCSVLPQDLPSLATVVRDLLICAVVEEIGFYYTHRLAHWGPLYRHVHKQHHEWTAPIGITCVYAHPLEHVVCNLLPFTLGAALAGSHMLTTLIWYTVGLSSTIIAHSNYHLPFLPSPEAHDFHHLKFNVNYCSVFGFFDWLHGTDVMYRENVASRRHKILLGLTPMRIKLPEVKAKAA